MDGYKFLKPVNQKAIIRDPNTKVPLNENGELKAWIGKEGTFWRRRVNEGSVVIVDETQEKKEDVSIKKGAK
jgi:hypothetical protein